MEVLESLGVGSYTASQFQGKVSAGAFFPEIHAWSYYFQYHMVKSSSGELQPSVEFKLVASNILKYDFSQHPFWKDRVQSSN
ncbi:hypothetical protein KC921_00420 [Candidatus Woesebacteria bacterium]|nr:hypothetical protein [Candidatus Woesebacteria bacterium]